MNENWELHFQDVILKCLDAGKMIEIDENYRIYVNTLSGNAEKFKRCFIRTWSSIPEKHKALLFSYWNKQSQLGYCPMELSIYCSDNVYATTELKGTQIKFNSHYFDEMPESACQFYIAHELGHCMQAALGIHSIEKDGIPHSFSIQNNHIAYADSNGDFWGYTEEHENDADRWAIAWEQDKMPTKTIPLPDQSDDSLVWIDYELLVSYEGMIGVEDKNIRDTYINKLLDTVFINSADKSGKRKKLIWKNNND